MTADRTHLTAERRWLFAVLLLIIALVATGCGGGLEVQAAAPAARGGAPMGAPQDPLPATSASAAALPARELSADSLPDAYMVTYRVGQTAAVGSLRVTLDKAVVTAGEAGNWAEAGKRFLLVYITVENTGKAAQSLSFFSTSVRDIAGRHYFVEPYAGYLSAAQPLDASIPPGGQMSGNRGYMLPANAGDLIWTGENAGHRAVFAVSTADLVALREQ